MGPDSGPIFSYRRTGAIVGFEQYLEKTTPLAVGSIIAVDPEPSGVMMKSPIETAIIVTACGSAVCWFLSAICRIPHIRLSKEHSDELTELSKALRRMNRWNFWAAGLMGITALLSALGRYLG